MTISVRRLSSVGAHSSVHAARAARSLVPLERGAVLRLRPPRLLDRHQARSASPSFRQLRAQLQPGEALRVTGRLLAAPPEMPGPPGGLGGPRRAVGESGPPAGSGRRTVVSEVAIWLMGRLRVRVLKVEPEGRRRRSLPVGICATGSAQCGPGQPIQARSIKLSGY